MCINYHIVPIKSCSAEPTSDAAQGSPAEGANAPLKIGGASFCADVSRAPKAGIAIDRAIGS
jgi:hypothetical protein